MKMLSFPCSVEIALLTTMVITATAISAPGQDKNISFKNSTTVIGGGPMRPTPLDKCLALNSALGNGTVKWKEVINRTEVNIDPDTLKDTKVAIPAVLGFRICDGIIAMVARDAEKLNACADHIEKLAKKLGVADEDLRRAKMVRSFATRGEWGRVYLELGYLQQDIERVVERESGEGGKASMRKILYAAGWLQGARYVSGVVKDNYNLKIAGILREPLLVKELKSDLDGAGLPNEGIVKLISESMIELQKLVNVELRAPLPKENVESMAALTAKTVVACVKEAK